MPVTTKVENERRLLAIQGWLIEGSPYSLILRSILDQNWVATQRQAERLIKQARARWIDFEDDKLEGKRKFKIQELKQLKRTLAAKFKGTPEGIKALLAVEKEIIKLEGLSNLTPQKIQVSGDEEKPIAIKHIPSDIDYSKLSDEVLYQIAMARKPTDEEA